MSIFNGSSPSELSEAWFGSNKLSEIWVGNNKVWPTGPDADAAFRLTFDSQATFLNNTGTASTTIPTMTSSGSITFDKDHAIFGTNGRLFAEPSSSWIDGYTLSMWTRDTPANSGWRTIMHRAMPSGTLTNEAYIVHNTSATTTTTVSGLKFGSTHREFAANYSLPVGVDWFHTVVVWERISSGTFRCRFYINGIPRGSFDGTGYSASDQFSTEELYIGGNRTAGEWSGRMDDLIMWRRPLSDAEVLELYNMGRSAAPQITTTSVNQMKITIPYSQQFEASFPVETWSAVGVPPGLTFSSTGLLSGTPTQITSGTMTVTATAGAITDQRTYSWQVASNLVSLSVPFDSNLDIDNNFPIRGFDARTSSSSPRNPAFTFSGMLVAGDNNVATYWQALHGTEVKSETVQWNMLMGNVMNTRARPTEIILSSDANFQNQLLLQLGSDGMILVSRTTTATLTNVRTALSRTIGTNSTITVQRSGLSLTVYHNATNVYSHTGTTSTAPAWFRTAGRAYTGITMYSTSGQWSSRVADFSVTEY